MVVVDASVIYKWLVDERPIQTTQKARNILDKFLSNEEEVICPDILLYELANTFAFKTNLSTLDVRRIWGRFIVFKIPVMYPDFVFMTEAIKFSRKFKVSIYDAVYAVLAQDKGCILITADAKFADQVNLPFGKKLG